LHKITRSGLQKLHTMAYYTSTLEADYQW